MCLTALAVTEMALARAGVPVTLGSGVAAAQGWYAFGQDRTAAIRLAAE
jgi:alanine-glyoxylate transaminase/serine-glyoxylate transaminase/serine-pyruvate transaminase